MALSCGHDHMAVVTREGQILSWGIGLCGHLIQQAPAGPTFKAVACGYWYTAGLTREGQILCWDSFLRGEYELAHCTTQQAPTGETFQAVACAGEPILGFMYLTYPPTRRGQTAGLTIDGRILVWGSDEYGQVSGVPAGEAFKAVACGWRHTAGLTLDGRILAWGDDEYGQVSGVLAGEAFQAVACGGKITAGLAWGDDGRVRRWGHDRGGQISQQPLASRAGQAPRSLKNFLGPDKQVMVFAWDVVDLALLVLWAQQYGTHLAEEDSKNMVSFVIIVACVIIPGCALLFASAMTFYDHHRVNVWKMQPQYINLQQNRNLSVMKDRLHARINNHVRREVAYDIFQMVAIAYVTAAFHFDEDKFPLKKALDFFNISSTIVDCFVLKGPTAFKACGNPVEARKILDSFLDPDEEEEDAAVEEM